MRSAVRPSVLELHASPVQVPNKTFGDTLYFLMNGVDPSMIRLYSRCGSAIVGICRVRT